MWLGDRVIFSACVGRRPEKAFSNSAFDTISEAHCLLRVVGTFDIAQGLERVDCIGGYLDRARRGDLWESAFSKRLELSGSVRELTVEIVIAVRIRVKLVVL